MTIPGVPEGYEIRTVYDAQSLADAIVQGDQRLQPGERIVCAIIRRIEPACTWPHGVFANGYVAQDQDGGLYWWNEYPKCGDSEWVGRSKFFCPLATTAVVFRSDLPWTERIQQVGPTIEATLRGKG